MKNVYLFHIFSNFCLVLPIVGLYDFFKVYFMCRRQGFLFRHCYHLNFMYLYWDLTVIYTNKKLVIQIMKGRSKSYKWRVLILYYYYVPVNNKISRFSSSLPKFTKTGLAVFIFMDNLPFLCNFKVLMVPIRKLRL